MAVSDRERWDVRHREAGPLEPTPVPWVDQVAPLLPVAGRALDLASGRGRVALALARLGLETVACDISEVGLGAARQAARSEGLELRTLTRDLAEEGIPRGPWDVIACFHYLDRDLLRGAASALAEGGLLLVEIATEKNLERHPRPSRRFLLETGELPRLVGDLTVVSYDEGWFEARHLARLLARRGALSGGGGA